MPVLGLAVVGLAAAYTVGPAWAWPFWAAAAGVAYLFRAPHTLQSDLPLAVVSPARGVVEAVDAAYDPWLERNALRVSIRVRFPGIGVIFSPANGKITDYWTDLGAASQRRAEHDAGPEKREHWLRAWLSSPTRYTVALLTDAGDPVVYTISSRRSYSRLKLDRAPGERAVRSRRSGFVYFASRVDVLVPPGARADVRVGERVRAGSDIIATLVHG